MLLPELAFAAVLGLVLGSFITLASYRLPRDQEIFVSASRCTACGAKLRMRDLVPVASWLMNKGCCRHCGARVHWRYPLIEIATAFVFVLLAWRYGFTVQAALLALLAVWLLVMIVADFEHYLIPDEVHYVLIPLGVIYRFYVGAPWTDTLYGALLGGGIGLSLRFGYLWFRNKEALGWGDVKFLATVGTWLGLLPMVPFLFFSGLLGILTGVIWRACKRGAVFPFGPALALSLFLCVAFPEAPQAFWSLQRLWMP